MHLITGNEAVTAEWRREVLIIRDRRRKYSVEYSLLVLFCLKRFNQDRLNIIYPHRGVESFNFNLPFHENRVTLGRANENVEIEESWPKEQD